MDEKEINDSSIDLETISNEDLYNLYTQVDEHLKYLNSNLLEVEEEKDEENSDQD